jgi:hypothetical protein
MLGIGIGIGITKIKTGIDKIKRALNRLTFNQSATGIIDTNFLLLSDGVSRVLLSDNSSRALRG